jgi:processing peptidase subunit beta
MYHCKHNLTSLLTKTKNITRLAQSTPLLLNSKRTIIDLAQTKRLLKAIVQPPVSKPLHPNHHSKLDELVPLIIPETPVSRTAQLLGAHPETKITTLPNGLRIASETIPGPTATVGIWIDTGSRYESEANNGVAHFLEHMSFKGTEKRSRVKLETEIENIGGHLNAYTSREQTVFYAKVLKNNVGQALDILADIVQNSKVTEEDVNAERGTILREMEVVDSQMEEVIFDRLHGTAFRGTALGRTILGTTENVLSITRNDILDYVRTHYTAPRMVVAAAGGVDHDELVRLSEQLFKNLPSAPPAGKEPHKEPAKFTGSEVRVRFDDMPAAHIALAYPTAGWNDPDYFTLLMIQTLLGSWNRSVHGGIHSSSKFIESVAKFEAAHSVTTFNTAYSDTGLFGIYGITGVTDVNNLSHIMAYGIRDMSYRVTDNQIMEAKNQLKMSLFSNLDAPTTACEEIGRQLLTIGRRMHPVEMLARIDAVDKHAVQECAQRYFYDRDHALAAIGPIYELPDYYTFRISSHYTLM